MSMTLPSRSSLGERIRGDFPILSTLMEGHPLIYFDNAATTQKPQAVIDSLVRYYTHDNANIHRGAYELSQRATDAFEAARHKVAAFLNADDPVECIFVRGSTEGINLVAYAWGAENLSSGDEIVLTGLEHHSNIVPWQLLCDRVGAKIRVVHPQKSGAVDLAEFEQAVSKRTKLVSVQHVSNALGTIHDIQSMITIAKRYDCTVLVDGAQWIAHGRTNVKELGCDFYTFSAHKLYGPTGIGVLWGKRSMLEKMPPFQGGGDMIESVSFSGTTYAPLPSKFEAGTPDIAGAIGLGAAIDYVQHIGFEQIAAHEDALLDHATQQLEAIEGLRIIGDAQPKAAVISFVIESPSIAPLDIASALSRAGIAIRTGHHCCMPLMDELNVAGTSRASFAIYNTIAEVDRMVEVLQGLIASRRQQQALAREQADASGSQTSDGEIRFAQAYADSPASAADHLAEEFLIFDDRESKTEFLMELANEVENNFEQLKAISSAVPGCMSEVYLIGRPQSGNQGNFEFVADSNAEIVRGLICLLQKLFSGQRPSDILAFDTASFFRRIGLDQFISTQRRSGLDGMIRRIHALSQGMLDRASN